MRKGAYSNSNILLSDYVILIIFIIEQDFKEAIARYEESLKEVTKFSVKTLKTRLQSYKRVGSEGISWMEIMYELLRYVVMMRSQKETVSIEIA